MKLVKYDYRRRHEHPRPQDRMYAVWVNRSRLGGMIVCCVPGGWRAFWEDPCMIRWAPLRLARWLKRNAPGVWAQWLAKHPYADEAYLADLTWGSEADCYPGDIRDPRERS